MTDVAELRRLIDREPLDDPRQRHRRRARRVALRGAARRGPRRPHDRGARRQARRHDPRTRASASCSSSCRVRTGTSRPDGTATSRACRRGTSSRRTCPASPRCSRREENLRVLDRLVARFEGRMPEPRLMWERPNDPDYVERLERGTVGFRLTPTRVVAKRKLSQNKTADVVETVIAELSGDGPYANPGTRRRDAPRPRRRWTARDRGSAAATVGTITRRPGRRRRRRSCFRPTARSTSSSPTASSPTSRRPAPCAPRGEVLDADGAWLIPGLWDHHVHVVQWALAAQREPLGHARLGRARGRGSWATRAVLADGRRVGTGFRDALWPDVPEPGRARRGHRRHPDLPDQRRRAQRVAQHRRAAPRGASSPTASASCARRPRSRSPVGSTTSTPPIGDPLVARDGAGCGGPRRRRPRRPRHGVERGARGRAG